MKLVLLHVLFLVIALFIAFGLIPFDHLYFDKVPSEEIQRYYQDAFSFKSYGAWKIVFTWFLGLTCGRLILRALSKNTQTTKSIDSDSKKKNYPSAESINAIPKKINVLFVCMGNICRSPTAHGVFQKMVDDHGLTNVISVDSAGTFSQQAGQRPDKRAIDVAAKRGYNLTKLRARKVVNSDFEEFNYILAMDDENYTNLIEQCEKAENEGKISRFLEFALKADVVEVPDPYYGDAQGFETVLNLVEDACLGLLKHIRTTHLPS